MVVNDQRRYGTGKDATNLAKVPKSGFLNVQLHEHKSWEHCKIDEVDAEILDPRRLNGERCKVGCLESHQDETCWASVPHHLVVELTRGMMCGLHITQYERELHHHGSDEQRVSPLVVEWVDNHQGHQDYQGAHEQDNTLCLRLEWPKAWVLETDQLKIEAKEEENEPSPESLTRLWLLKQLICVNLVRVDLLTSLWINRCVFGHLDWVTLL